MPETFFPYKYVREIQHNSLTLVQSLHYGRLVTDKSTQSILYTHTPTIENTNNDVLDT